MFGISGFFNRKAAHVLAQMGFVEKGTIKGGVKAGQIVQWLKDDHDLGRGHAMAIYALLKGVKGQHEK